VKLAELIDLAALKKGSLGVLAQSMDKHRTRLDAQATPEPASGTCHVPR